MCIPDLSLICEIMLMAEGFQQSKLLSRKFVILYKLCEDLLSQSKHYDWKLRAIKTTLYVAGGMKRQAPHLSEDKVIRAVDTPSPYNWAVSTGAEALWATGAAACAARLQPGQADRRRHQHLPGPSQRPLPQDR